MDDRILLHLRECDEIWHAGDIGNMDVMLPLQGLAVLRAVHGNIDGGDLRKIFPETLIFEIEGLTILITHIAGRPGKYPAKVNSALNSSSANMLVCGHSHICMVHKNPQTGFIHINPGAVGRHGFHKVRTLIRLSIDKGQVVNLEVVELGPRST